MKKSATILKSFRNLLILAFLSLFLFGCATNSLRVPGEAKIILKNLAVEYNSIGDGYMGIKNYTKAAEYYEKAMRDKDLYLSVYYKLARAYALGKSYDKAIESYEYLLSLDAENTSLKSSLAYVYAMKGDYDEAIRRYKILMDENPYDQSLIENYTALLINIGRAEDAEPYYFLIKEKFPDSDQLTSFAQKLSDLIDNFDPEKDPNAPPDGAQAADDEENDLKTESKNK